MDVISSFSTRAYIGERLRVGRVVKGYTQGDVARRLGVRQATICQYEKGLSIPNFCTMLELAQLYGVGVEYFSPYKK